jgi:hypothetical protein
VNEVLQQFWESQLPVPGLLGWGVFFANGAFQSGCSGETFAPAQIEQLMKRMLAASKSLQENGIQPLRLCWVFEHARLYLVKRKDACCLGLLMQNHPEVSTNTPERILSAFNDLVLI